MVDDGDAAYEIEKKIETINQLFEIKVDHLSGLRKITSEYRSLKCTEAFDDIHALETQIVKLVAELVVMQNQLNGIERLVSTQITNCPELSTWLLAIGLTDQFRTDILGLFHTVEMLRKDSQEQVLLYL